MQIAKRFCFLFILLILSNLSAIEKEKVAVVEFKNRSESALSFNGNDLASWMSNYLKKRDRFDPVDRKVVAKIIKDAEWLDERLGEETEAKLREIPSKYVLYGSLVNWRSSVNTVTSGEITPRKTPQSGTGVFVVYYFELVDLETGKSIKTFQTDGEGITAPGPGPMQGSAANDQLNFDRLYEEACKQATRRAAVILDEIE